MGVPTGNANSIPLVTFFASATCTPDGKTIGSSSTPVLAANDDRKTATFVNDSDEVIYLSKSATAVMNKGIRLNAAGGVYEINQTNLYLGVVSAICASGSKNLCVEEGL